MIKGPYNYRRNSEGEWEVFDSLNQVLAIVSSSLPFPCQETTAKVLSIALNEKFTKQ